MSQIEDLRPHAMGGAAKAVRPSQPGSLHILSDGDLADEYRGLGFAKRRTDDRMKAIEAELERRQLAGPVKGKLGVLERRPTTLLDLPRLRAERPDIVLDYAKADGGYWSARTLTAEERAA